MRPNILVTNDDGIDSPGLHALAACAARFGSVCVAAPATEASGTSASLMVAADHRAVPVETLAVPGCYAVAGPPALIVLIADDGGFGPRPDVVLSGVNRGANVSRAVLHSGTVGAALTGAINGARALAVSLDVAPDAAEAHWSSATAVVADVLPRVLAAEPGTVFNLNVPNSPAPASLRWATLADRGQVRTTVTAVRDGVIEVSTVVAEPAPAPGTDAALLARGHATITPLRSVAEATELFPPD